MLKKVNENIKFLNSYNYIIENKDNKKLDIFDLIFIVDKINNKSWNLIRYYYNIGMIGNIYTILKNIAYKKQQQLKNYYLHDIKF